MLQLTNLKKIYNRTEMLTNVNYIFNKGQLYPVLGGHSSGKTLLCECIAGLCKPDGGKVYIGETHDAFMVHESASFPPYLTMNEYLKTICDIDTALNALERVGIPDDYLHMLLKDCELEIRRRLQIAVMLIRNPYVMVLDVPFDYCSDEYFDDIIAILDELQDDHIIIITTGSLDIARQIYGDVAVLNNGELNMVQDESFSIPEIKQAVLNLLTEGEEDEIN